MSFLELNKVTKVYPNGTKAVHETSMKVEDGEFMVLLDQVDAESQLY